jgi:quinol monooxygenase YgiN
MKKKIIARVFIKKNAIEVFKKLAIELVQRSRNETDCLQYNLFQDVLDSEEFVFIEEYSNQDALDFHFKSDYLNAFVKDIQSLQLKDMIIEII